MSVPSFTSFPTLELEPSKTSKEDKKSDRRNQDSTAERSSSSKRRRERDSSRERRRDKDRSKGEEKDKDRRRNKDKEKHREKDRKRRRHDDVDHKPDVPSTVDESYRIFYSDRKPDRLNIQYGGLHSGNIPKYRAVYGGKYAIGLPHGLVLHQTGKGVEVCAKSRNNKLSGINDSRTRSLLALPPNRRLVNPEESQKYIEVDGYIRIPSRRGKSKPEDTYRSINEAKDGDSSASESDSSSELSNDGHSSEGEDDKRPETSQQAQLRTLEQKLAQDKSSIETWLSLLDTTLSSIPITSKNATKARSDITVSLLGRAISSHPVVEASPLVRIKYLKAGEDLWDGPELIRKWETALGLGSVALWMEWFEWRMRNNRTGLEGIVEDVSRLLASVAFQGTDEEAEMARLRAFWRAAEAVRSAGYTERAIAMFQAQLELTFESPLMTAKLSFIQQLDELEEFWDNEAPRLLEEGAKGWKHWYQSGKPEASSTNALTTSASDIKDLDPYRQWAANESLHDTTMKLPTRSTEETEDPYSTVFFSDIRPFLVKIETPEAKNALRLATLAFLGLPLPDLPTVSSSAETDMNWDDRWAMKPYAKSSLLSTLFPRPSEHNDLVGHSIAGAIIASEKEYRDSFGPIKHWANNCLSPLDVWVQSGGSRAFLWNATDVEQVDPRLAVRALSQLRRGDDDFEWDVYALAFEAASNMKSALKLSKALLSVPRDTLEYWNAHAQLERVHGRLDGARKIFQTVLVNSQPRPSQRGLSALWWNWAEMEWLSGKDEQALNVILRSAGVESATGIGTLRAKRALDDAISSATRWSDCHQWVKSRALLELLSGEEIRDVMALFDAQISRLRCGEVDHESLTMASVLFVFNYRVVLKGKMQPALLRDRAEAALQQYPSNSVLLGVFLEGEKGQGVWGKVRGMIGASDGKVKDVARRMEEVWIAGWDKGRWLGEVERTRSGLAAAVEHERTRASPVIWRLYLEFEIQVKHYQNAKKLLFRAIGECPLVKELYLLAFGPLRSVFDGRELQRLADVMAERGLRLHAGLDEVVDIVDTIKDQEEHDHEEEDEIEHNARELRRLMPFSKIS